MRGRLSDYSSCFIVSPSSQRKESYELVDGNCTSDCYYTKVTEEAEAIDDATAGMLVVVLLFVLPAVPTFWPFRSRN